MNSRFIVFFVIVTVTIIENVSLAQKKVVFKKEGSFIDLPFILTNYGSNSGLPQNQIFDVLPKKSGELIISTPNGIVEFDGARFLNLHENKLNRYFTPKILFWNEPQKCIYTQEYNGCFSKLNPTYKKISDFTFGYLIGDCIIGVNSKGEIKKKHTRDKSFQYLIKTNIQNPICFFLNYKTVFMSSDKGTFKLNLNSGKMTQISRNVILSFKKNYFSDILYAYSENKLYKLKNGTLIEIPLTQNKNRIHITDIEFVNENEFFVSSSEGLFYIMGNKISHINTRNGLTTNNLECLYYNSIEKCLFIGTSNLGLLKLERQNCKNLFSSSFRDYTSFGSIIVNYEGKILTCNSHNKIFEINNDKIVPYYRLKPYISSLATVDKSIYVGTWGEGVFVLKDKKIYDKIQFPKLRSNNVHAVYKDKKSEIWIGNSRGVSVGTCPENIKPFRSKEIAGLVISICELKDGRICFGGSDGVYILNNKRKIINKIDRKAGLKGKEVRSFLEGKDGRLWIGTYGGGLYCYHKNLLTCLNEKTNCKLSNDAFTLAKDKRGFVYITSNNGLWVIHEKKLNDFLENKIKWLIPYCYGKENGIRNTEFNGGFQNNFLLTKDEQFYFPTIEGILKVKPDKYNLRKMKPKIRFIKINDTLVPKNLNVFDRSTFSIEFGFNCPDFFQKYNMFYQYQLIGPNLSTNWSSLQKNDFVGFSMLSPGKYTFRVRALDAFNDQDVEICEYKFEIKPDFTETWIFWFLCFVLFIATIIFIIRFRNKQLKLKVMNENKITNTMLELKLKAVHSRMNPHFIFNSLNNIVFFMNEGRNKEAEDLLQDFSLLLRQFLEKGDQTFITLKEEFDILNLYLAIEQKRYNYSFTYSFYMKKEINHIKIPTLLLQPIIENAVKHGISHSNDSCSITIKAEEINNSLLVSVIDNGIGRKNSMEINKNRKNHTSLGVELVKQKIEMIKQKYNLEIEFYINDLNTTNHSGTVVTFKFNLNV